MHISLTLPGREAIAFDMDYDPDFIADVSTRVMVEHDGCCEPEVAHVMNHALREGDTVVDAGANVGFFTLLMSRMVGPTGRVLAFEPGINNIAKLQGNIDRNHLANVSFYERALWSEIKAATLHMCVDSGNNALISSDETISHMLVRAERLCEHIRHKSVRFIKIDVEGAEEHVLRGAGLVFEPMPAFITCEMNVEALARFDSSPRKIRNYMLGRGYDTFVMHRDGAIPSLLPPRTEFRCARQNANLLFSTVDRIAEAYPEVTCV